ncbi:MAG: efflux RND transporter permease subunit [Candidatus Aminicenantes bacterium]|nr:efflux RND transporter permease subunit [Candidatus Aminicenantes bacterium]
MKLARLAIDRPVTVYMFFFAVVLLGFVSLRELSVDLLPEISYPRLSVVTRYSGVAPEEMETLVTKPLESAVSRIAGLRRVESVSKEGVSVMTLEFDWGTDMNFTLLHTREQLDMAKDRLPQGVESPTILTLDPQSKPIMTLALSGDRGLLELKEFAEELVKPRLEQIEGIGQAEITGGVEREIHVEVDPKLLSLYGLTINEIAARIDAFNQNLQGGTIRKGTFKYALRIVGEFEAIEEIGQISLKAARGGGVVRLKDVATVSDGIKERQGMTRFDGRESVGLLVRKEAGANTVKVTRQARKVIDQIRRENPGIDLTVVSEQSRYIEEAIGAVRNEIIQGAILAFLVLLIFLQEWKTPLIIDTVIPISIIGTFSLMFFSKITLNIMSLGGLALGVGMLDDCAVVVSENIYRHRSLGKSPKEAAYVGTSEVGGAIFSTALTTVVVFLPIIYVHGIAGQLFKDTALTVAFALMASLLVSLTLIGTLQSRSFEGGAVRWDRGAGGRFRWGLKEVWGGHGPESGKRSGFVRILTMPFRALQVLVYAALKAVLFAVRFLASYLVQLAAFVLRLVSIPFRPLIGFVFRGFNSAYGAFVAWYERFLTWSLNHKGRITAAAVLFFGGSAILGFNLKRELMPKIESTAFSLQLKTPVDYSLDQTSAMAAMLEQSLRGLPGVRTIMSQVGIVSGEESANPEISVNSAEILVNVTAPGDVDGVLESLRRRLASYPDLQYTISREQSTLSQLLALSIADIGLKVKGDDLERLKTISGDLVAKLRDVPGIADVATNIGEGKPEFKVRIRPEAVRKYANLSPAALGDFLVNAVRGKLATQYNELEKKYGVLVRLRGAEERNIDALLDEPYPHQGTLIPLRELVDYEIVKGPKEIRRENQQREVLVTANLRGAKISQVVPRVERAIRELDLPPDYRILFSGEREEMSKSFRSLVIALLLGAVLTYMVMAAQFESLLHPFLVMFTLPMGAAGTALALWVTGQTVNVISIIGMVVLIGLVVDNATVEVDYTNQLRRGGKKLREAVFESARTRLRPILISSLSTLFGLFPLALGLETGGEIMKPLGIVVIGGLTCSTFLTLVLIPVLYEWAESRRSRP